jgi:hypothetical protein
MNIRSKHSVLADLTHRSAMALARGDLNGVRISHGQKIETAERMEAVASLAKCLSLRRGSRADFGRPSLMQRDVRRPVAALELLARAARAWIVAARSRHLVELPQFFLSTSSAPGKPAGMDVASRGGDPINKSLMSCNGILTRLDQLL